MRVLVTGSSVLFSPPLIAGLGHRGAEITAADSLKFSVGKVSRFTHRTLLVPRPGTNPEGYLQAILQELRSRRYDLLLPSFEESLLLAEYQNELQTLTNVFLPDFETMLAFHHKPSLHAFCDSLGIATPPTVLFRLEENLVDQVNQRLSYPVVLKQPMGNNSVGRKFCRDAGELRQAWSQLPETCFTSPAVHPFVQQRIDGELLCTLMFCHRGQKLAELIYRTLRSFPDAGGTSVYRESITHPQIAAITSRLAEETNWTGFVGFDFLVDRATGQPFLIDANPRPNPAVGLGYACGIDWTGILLELLDRRVPQPVQAQPGLRTRTLMLDVAWLFEGFQPGPNWPRRMASRVARFVAPEWSIPPHHWKQGDGWKRHVAAAWHGLRASAKAVVTGQSIGQLFLEDANYDATAAASYAQRRGAPTASVHRSLGVISSVVGEPPPVIFRMPAPHFSPTSVSQVG